MTFAYLLSLKLIINTWKVSVSILPKSEKGYICTAFKIQPFSEKAEIVDDATYIHM
jgi:hypothetical protein